MRKLVRCYNQFKGESKTQTHIIRNIEMNMQMEAKLASCTVEEGSQSNLSLPGRNFLVCRQELCVVRKLAFQERKIWKPV